MADAPDLSLLRQRVNEIGRRLGDCASTLPHRAATTGEAATPGDGPARTPSTGRDLVEMAAALHRIELLLARVDASLAAAATKVELERLRAQFASQIADKPGRGSLWLVAAILLAGVAGLLHLGR